MSDYEADLRKYLDEEKEVEIKYQSSDEDLEVGYSFGTVLCPKFWCGSCSFIF